MNKTDCFWKKMVILFGKSFYYQDLVTIRFQTQKSIQDGRLCGFSTNKTS